MPTGHLFLSCEETSVLTSPHFKWVVILFGVERNSEFNSLCNLQRLLCQGLLNDRLSLFENLFCSHVFSLVSGARRPPGLGEHPMGGLMFASAFPGSQGFHSGISHPSGVLNRLHFMPSWRSKAPPQSPLLLRAQEKTSSPGRGFRTLLSRCPNFMTVSQFGVPASCGPRPHLCPPWALSPTPWDTGLSWLTVLPGGSHIAT